MLMFVLYTCILDYQYIDILCMYVFVIVMINKYVCEMVM